MEPPQPGGLGSSPSAASPRLCGRVPSRLCASVSPSIKRGASRYPIMDGSSPSAPSDAGVRPPPWSCLLCLPDSPLRGSRPFPPRRRHSRPGRSGKHSVVCSRLSGSSEPQMWAEWAAAGRAQAGDWGDCAPPGPPPQRRAHAGEVAGSTHRWACGGGPPLLRALPGLPSAL